MLPEISEFTTPLDVQKYAKNLRSSTTLGRIVYGVSDNAHRNAGCDGMVHKKSATWTRARCGRCSVSGLWGKVDRGEGLREWVEFKSSSTGLGVKYMPLRSVHCRITILLIQSWAAIRTAVAGELSLPFYSVARLHFIVSDGCLLAASSPHRTKPMKRRDHRR